MTKDEIAIYEKACALDNQDVPLEEWPSLLIAALNRAGFSLVKMAPQYTTGHCPEKAKPGGCHLHNLHCGYPDCDRRSPNPEEQS